MPGTYADVHSLCPKHKSDYTTIDVIIVCLNDMFYVERLNNCLYTFKLDNQNTRGEIK